MSSYDNIPHDDHFMALAGFIVNQFATGPFGTKHIYRALQGTDIPYAAHPRLCAVLKYLTEHGKLERISRSVWRAKPAPAPVPEPEPVSRATMGTYTDRALARIRVEVLAAFDRFMETNHTATRSAIRAEVARIIEATVR